MYYDITTMKERKITGRVDIFGSQDDAAMIMQVIGEAFTEEEIGIMCKREGVKVFFMEKEGDLSGEYYPKQERYPVPVIRIVHNAGDDTIVHEFVHHLRTVDDNRKGIVRTPFPMNEEGEIINSSFFEKLTYDASNVEESATVAETTARRRSRGNVSGYYSMIDGVLPRCAYIHDRLLLTGSEDEETSNDLRGEKAVDAVNRLYSRTKISDARIFSEETNARTAKESWGLLKKEGLIKE